SVKPMDVNAPVVEVRFKDIAAAAKTLSSISTPATRQLATTNRGFTLLGFKQRFKNWGVQLTATVHHLVIRKPGYGRAKKALDEARAAQEKAAEADRHALFLADLTGLDEETQAYADALTKAQEALAQNESQWSAMIQEAAEGRRDVNDPQWGDVMA